MDSNGSSISLKVELPTFSHNFTLSVPRSATVLDIKNTIARECVGQPRVEGQRLIWRGRFLRDEETVDEIWKVSNDPKIVHLSVNPSAWTTTPPEYPTAVSPELNAAIQRPYGRLTPTTSGTATPLTPPDNIQSIPATPTVLPRPITTRTPSTSTTQPWSPRPNTYYAHLEYIHFVHRRALSVLMNGQDTVSPTTPIPTQWRDAAKRAVNAQGLDWPAQLDEVLPTDPPDASGVRYEVVSIDGQDFLKLMTPDAQPTPAQVAALKTLTYTFPLLYIPPPPPSADYVTSSHSLHVPVSLNTLLQNAGLGNLRVREPGQPAVRLHGHPHGHVNPFPNIALRPLIGPLLMLAVRTVLLLYFISPTSQPVFGALVCIWLVYEIVGAIRGAIVPPANQRRDGQPRVDGAAAPAAAQGVAPAPGNNAQQNNAAVPPQAQPRAAVPAQRAVPAPSHSQRQANAVLDAVSTMNLRAEERALDAPADAPPTPPPTFMHKMRTFIGLFVLTIHPAVWNRRRVELMQREGRVRLQMNNIERPPNAGDNEQERQEEARREEARQQLLAQHGRRPVWVQQYVARARADEWYDDM